MKRSEDASSVPAGSGPTRRRRLRLVLRVCGWVLALVACVIVAVRVWESAFWQADGVTPGRLVIAAILGSLAYAFSLVFVAGSWAVLAGAGGIKARSSRRSLVWIWGVAQILKYLPGNVVHLAGRHAAGRRLGVSHTGLVAAATAEALLLIALAVLIGLPAADGLASELTAGLAGGGDGPAGLVQRIAGRLTDGVHPAAFGVVALLGMGVVWWVWPMISRRFASGESTRTQRWRATDLLAAIGLDAAFLGAAGLVGLGLLAVAFQGWAPDGLSHAGFIVSALTLSWVAGLLTPGAPGGLGVREFLLLTTLGPALGEGPAATLAVLYRVATTGGDAIFFALSLWMSRGLRQSWAENTAS